MKTLHVCLQGPRAWVLELFFEWLLWRLCSILVSVLRANLIRSVFESLDEPAVWGVRLLGSSLG